MLTKNEDDKTKKLHVEDHEPIPCHNEAAYRLAKAVEKDTRSLTFNFILMRAPPSLSLTVKTMKKEKW